MIMYSPQYLIEYRKRLGGKLKSLLGQRNTEQSITLSSDMNLNNAIGFGISGDGKTYPNNLWGGTYGINISIKQDHYYLYAIKVNKNILSISNTWGGFYFSTKGGYIDNQTTPYTDGEWYIGIQKSNKDFTSDNFWGIFARALALEKGTTITCYKTIMLDLTKAKLDTLTPEQIYNLLTLNGTDFTDLELLANGYQVDLSKWKQQTTNSVDLGELKWGNASGTDNSIRVACTGLSDRLSMGGASVSPNDKISYVDYSMGVDDSNIGHISTKTYSYYIYITLRKSDIGWTDSDGNVLLNTKVQEYLSGIKLTYELSSSNNIGGSKYGFVKLKDLTWSYNSEKNHERFYTTLNMNRPTSLSSVANMFIEKYPSTSANNLYASGSGVKQIACYVAQNNNIQVSDIAYDNVTDFVKSLTDNDILVYELSNSLGNKLDNYSAEQVYYMFFSTLGNQKMYVPKGVEFESSDNVIIGTKYGIVDLGNYVWGYNGNYKFSFVSSDTLGNALKQLVKPTTADNYVGNVYLDGYTTISWNDMRADKDTDLKDKSIVVRTSGEIDIKDTRFTSYNAIQEYLKGKYLVFELRTPNGTDYNDLSAKQMYDLINDNAIDLLANGKSIGGIRSLFGKQDITSIKYASATSTYLFIGNGTCATDSDWSLTRQDYGIQVYSSHKYFICIKWERLSDAKKTEQYNCLFLTNSNGRHLNDDVYRNYHSDNYECNIVQPTTDSIAYMIRSYSNGTSYNADYDVPKSFIVIDLTALNLSTLSAQQVYTMLKEYNLYNLTTSGEIKIGGFIKPKPSNPTFTIDSVVYEYESGMTWGAWLDSSYNTGGFTHKEEYVVDSTNTYCVVKSDYSGKAYTYDYVESIAYIVVK